MRGDTERVYVGCAGPALQGRGSSPRAQRVDVGSKIVPRQRRWRGRRGWRLLRARKSSQRLDLARRLIRTRTEEVVLGGERSTSSRRPLLLGSWSQLLRRRGREVSAQSPSAQSKVDSYAVDYLCAQEQGMGHTSDEVWGGSGVMPAWRVARTCSVATWRTASATRGADGRHARAGRPARPSRRHRPASSVVDVEAVEQGGGRGRPGLEEPSLTNDAQVGFSRLFDG
jgi:hypothetical protein